MKTTDLIIIGSGPGGYRAAEYAAKHGLQVIVIEKDEPGGTCLNRGCIPTKTLCRNAEITDMIKEADKLGLKNLSYNIDFSLIKERQNTVIKQLRNGVEYLMSQPGITFVHGNGSFKDNKTVVVGNEEYTADNIIIATGAVPKMPNIPSFDKNAVITSDELLATDRIPQRLCIIGAGVIGMEFASIFSSFGSEVTVIEYMKECLPVLDSDVAARLRKTLTRKGIKFFMQSAVTAVTKDGVTFEKKGKAQTIEADAILVATGRRPNIEGLNLDASGVEYDVNGIATDENMMTNVPGIYAIGDVNNRCMLAHAATMQGIRAVNAILGKTDDIRFDIMPSAIFTNPEAASVGVSEDQCKSSGMAYTCHKTYHRANGKALAMNEPEGMVKLIADDAGKIIGCHAFGAHSADMVQEISVLMCRNTTVGQLKYMIYAHPTVNEMLQEAAEALDVK
ncbi:dihydrolipoyl dehydrogenase [Xylanibacter caecicola]|uniref:dihydrolipoyl dehydrogenase n=1 Tax=Xylanibacter caecicola TaxID=2736294 RepID=UPI00258CE2BC|nr:dihydrolipoyl dehydrogenase [Xylanibacter caecicola]